MKKLITIIAMTAALAGYAEYEFAYRIPAELQSASPVALGDLEWQQGTTPLLKIEVLSRGRAVMADTGTVVRMIIAPTGTGTYYAVATNIATATTGSFYYVQWPTIGTNSWGTNTSAQAWWFTIYFEKAGKRYWTGNGNLYIEKTTSTNPDGLVWQEFTEGGIASIFGRTGIVTARAADYAEFYLQQGAAGTSTNLSDYNNDAGFITSFSAAPVESVFGRTGSVVALSTDYDEFYSPTGHVHEIDGVTGLQDALEGKADTGDIVRVQADIDVLESNTLDRTGVRGMQADLNLGTNSLVFSNAVLTSTKIQLYDTLNTAKVAVADYSLHTNAQHILNTGYDGRLDVVETDIVTVTGDVAQVAADLSMHEGLTGTAVHGLGTMSTETATDYYTKTAADLLLDAKAGTAEVAQVACDLNDHELLEGTNVHGLGTAALEDMGAFDSAGSAGVVQTNLDTHIGLDGTNVHGLGTMSLESTGDYYTANAMDTLLDGKAGTGMVAAIDERVDSLEGHTSTWNQAAMDASSATDSIAEIELWPTGTWSQAATDATQATTDIAVIHLSTQSWSQAATDATQATTDIATLTGRVGIIEGWPTGTWSQAATDATQATVLLAGKADTSALGTMAYASTDNYYTASETQVLLAEKVGTNDAIYLAALTNATEVFLTNTWGWEKVGDHQIRILVDTNHPLESITGLAAELAGKQSANTNLDEWAAIGVSTKVGTNDPDYTNALAIALAAATNFNQVDSPTNWLSYDPATHTLSFCVTNVGSGGAGTITNMLSTDGSISWTDNGGPQPDGSVTSTVANWSAYPAQNTILQNVSSYPTNTTWVQKGHYVPGGPYHATSAIFSNEIYIIGGYRSVGSDATTNVFRYNGMRFEEVKGLPGAMANGRSAVLGDYLYVLDQPGGTNCYKFDGTDWTWFPAPPSGLLGDCGLVNYDSALYFVGGRNKATNVYSFDGTTYTARAGLPVGCHGHGIAVYSNKIWVVGGYQTMTNAFSFDGSSWAWAPGISAGMGQADLGVHTNTYIPYRIYSIGGMKSAWSWSSNSYVFNGDTWSPFPSPVSSTLEGACVEMYDDQLFYIGGGFNQSTVSSNIYVMYSKSQFSNSIAADSWFYGDVSAQTFTDRTPYPSSTKAAIDAIQSMKVKTTKIIVTNETWDSVVWDEQSKTNIYSGKRKVVITNEVAEGVDHESLDPILRAGEGRSLSMTVSVLSEVVKDLLRRLELLETSEAKKEP